MGRLEVYQNILLGLQNTHPNRMVQTKLNFSNLANSLVTSDDKCRVEFMYENLPIKVDIVICSVTSAEAGFTPTLITFDAPVTWLPTSNRVGTGISIAGNAVTGSYFVAEVQAEYCEVRAGTNLPASINNSKPTFTNHIQIYGFTTEHKVREVMGIHDGYN